MNEKLRFSRISPFVYDGDKIRRMKRKIDTKLGYMDSLTPTMKQVEIHRNLLSEYKKLLTKMGQKTALLKRKTREVDELINKGLVEMDERFDQMAERLLNECDVLSQHKRELADARIVVAKSKLGFV